MKPGNSKQITLSNGEVKTVTKAYKWQGGGWICEAYYYESYQEMIEHLEEMLPMADRQNYLLNN